MYLSELLFSHIPSRTIRSSDQRLLVVRRSRPRLKRDHAFAVIAPKLWNSSLLHIRAAPSLITFKSRLITHLFFFKKKRLLILGGTLIILLELDFISFIYLFILCLRLSCFKVVFYVLNVFLPFKLLFSFWWQGYILGLKVWKLDTWSIRNHFYILIGHHRVLNLTPLKVFVNLWMEMLWCCTFMKVIQWQMHALIKAKKWSR